MSRIPKSLNLATLLLLLASGVSILPISQPGIVPPVQAQTNINLALGKWMVQQGVRSQSLPSPRKLVIGARDNKSFFY